MICTKDVMIDLIVKKIVSNIDQDCVQSLPIMSPIHWYRVMAQMVCRCSDVTNDWHNNSIICHHYPYANIVPICFNQILCKYRANFTQYLWYNIWYNIWHDICITIQVKYRSNNWNKFIGTIFASMIEPLLLLTISMQKLCQN